MFQLPNKMKGVLLTGHGGFEELQYRNDLPVKHPDENEVTIQVCAAGVNNTDINTRVGWYSKSDALNKQSGWNGDALSFPRIQGADVCGHVVAVGSEVSKDRIGERVLIEPCIREINGKGLLRPWYLGSECNGGFAEYVTVSSRHAYKINSNLSDIELASFPCSYSTAENLLTKANVQAGENLLITGASGGVGSAVVQLAKARGAKVFAVTSQEKSEEITKLGASQILLRNESILETLEQDSLDVVIDVVAGPNWSELLDVLKPGGRYAVAGAISGASVNLDVRTLYLKDLSFFGCTVLEPLVFRNLILRIENGDIYPLVADVYPLEKIVEAQKMFSKKQHIGKIVLSVSSDN